MARDDFQGVSEQRKAALKRKRDAWALLEKGPSHARGAMYLGGYAIECKLKSIAMEIYRCRTLAQLAIRLRLKDSEVYSHGLEASAKNLPLYGRLQKSPVWRDFSSYVNRWRPSWRYDPNDFTSAHAEAFLQALDRVYHWLDSNQ
ncbi:MAG TPA: hypothetical protein VIM11_25290 [Tepidisphaeraceae bacterium]|jgi:hypothetical protein